MRLRCYCGPYFYCPVCRARRRALIMFPVIASLLLSLMGIANAAIWKHRIIHTMTYVGEQASSDNPPGRTIQLRGRLFASQEDATIGKFFTDPDGDSESITLTATDGGYVHDWLKGSVGSDAEITITVRKHKP